MAEMGNATLKEMDRVYHEVVASSRQQRHEQARRSESRDLPDELRTGTRTETLAPVPRHGKSRML